MKSDFMSATVVPSFQYLFICIFMVYGGTFVPSQSWLNFGVLLFWGGIQKLLSNLV